MLEVLGSLGSEALSSAATDELTAMVEKVVRRALDDPNHLDHLLAVLEGIVKRNRDDERRAFELYRLQLIRQTMRTDRLGVSAIAEIDAGRATADRYRDAGLYLCVRKSEWDRGCAYLSKGTPGKLREAATLTLSKSPDALRLADAWWMAAESLGPGESREALRLRAAELYESAKPSIAASKRAQAEQRIALARSKGPASPQSQPDPVAADRPQTIVYLLDCTGTMGGIKFGLMLKEVEASIEKLPDQTRVGVVFFAETATVHGKTPIALTPENREKLQQFILAQKARGSTNPLPGIEAAFSMKPDLILMLTDGEFDNLVSYDDVIRRFGALNKGRKVRVSTYMFGTDDLKGQEALRSVASQNNGRMLVVDLDDLARVRKLRQ